jgi:hypothetical protein
VHLFQADYRPLLKGESFSGWSSFSSRSCPAPHALVYKCRCCGTPYKFYSLNMEPGASKIGRTVQKGHGEPSYTKIALVNVRNIATARPVVCALRRMRESTNMTKKMLPGNPFPENHVGSRCRTADPDRLPVGRVIFVPCFTKSGACADLQRRSF